MIMLANLIAFTNVGQGLVMATAGALAESAGFRLIVVILAALNLLAIPLLPLVFRNRQNKP